MPHYDEGRLARLLRLLRAAPQEWIRRAQRIPFRSMTLTDRDLEELGRKLERDPSFRQQFDADPAAAAEAAGMLELGVRLRQEIRELVALAERVATDGAYRAELAAEPIPALEAVGVPAGSAESLLPLLAVPAETLENVPDVVAHRLGDEAFEERLLILLLTCRAVADELRAAGRRA